MTFVRSMQWTRGLGLVLLVGLLMALALGPTTALGREQSADTCSALSMATADGTNGEVQPGQYLWFNANFVPDPKPTVPTTYYVTNVQVQFTDTYANKAYSVAAPSAEIRLNDSTVSAPTSNFVNGQWIILIPPDSSKTDENFMTGLAWQNPTNGKVIQPKSFSITANFATSQGSSQFKWKFGAALYDSQFMSKGYAGLGVQLVHQGDHAGTPVNWSWQKIDHFVGGAGTGGSSYTGSWSKTATVTPCLNSSASTASPCSAVSTSTIAGANGEVAPGEYLWFNANFVPSPKPTVKTTYFVTNVQVQFTDTYSGQAYNVPAPSGQITLNDPTVSVPTSKFVSGQWLIQIPADSSQTDENFMTGLAWQNPTTGKVIQPKNFSITANFASVPGGTQVKWKFGAALYDGQFMSGGYGGLGVQLVHDGDHAGTPETWSLQTNDHFVGGAGTGGDSYTGAWSKAATVTPCPGPTTSTVGDKVWSDLNGNGVQDAGEPGVPGVPAALTDCLGNVIATTKTDGNGLYSFVLGPGLYYVKVAFGPLPSGYTRFTKQYAQGADPSYGNNNDSNAIAGTGVTDCLAIVTGQTNLSIDVGLVPASATTATVGGRVWNDANKNGIQDSGELGVAGVTAKLTDCFGYVLSTTSTDANGLYKFVLGGGTYYVKVAFGPLPTGYTAFTKQYAQGADPYFVNGNDSNANAGGVTDCMMISTGLTNVTIDAGMVK